MTEKTSVSNFGSVKDFIDAYMLHYNAGSLKRAAQDYVSHIEEGGKMMVTLAGAMSSARLGKILSQMIRENKVHAISCTGANLEEDIFRLVAHEHYLHIPKYRLPPEGEQKLLEKNMNRVTDLTIPEHEAMRVVEKRLLEQWTRAESEQKTGDKQSGRYFPHEFIYQLLDSVDLPQTGNPEHSWVLAAKEKNLPIFVPGWEDSTLGNMFVAAVHRGELKNFHTVKDGREALQELLHWYREFSSAHKMGFFQIGGGIAGDFSICVVPMIRQDLKIDVPLWSYFTQITDSQESYGGYSGAYPTEKITWDKLSPESRMHDIRSDATIVAPLIFAYVLA